MKDQEIKECWRPARYIQPNGDVLDFTGLYEVSDQGRVRSILNYCHTGKAKVLSLYTFRCIDGSICYKVCLRKDGKKYSKQVHRLVLSSFRPKGHPKGWFPNAEVDHIDARSSTSCDDRLCNLRWFTRKQNCNTEHHKELKSRAHTNHPTKSKRVRVKNLITGETTVYPSACEAGRSLGINPKVPTVYINQYNGFYKRLNLHFEYIE